MAGEKDEAKPLTSETKAPAKDGEVGSVVPIVIFAVVPLLLGYGITAAVYSWGAHAKYAANLAAVGDGKWGYAAAVVFGRTVVVINMLPSMYKNGILDFGSGNLRANPFIYKSVGEGAGGHHVVFDDQGMVGKYNRANRSLHHMIESMGGYAAGLYMASVVFPFPVFVTSLVFAAGRLMHSLGYTKGYGVHALGFLTTTFADSTLQGMLAFVALNA